MIITTNTIFYVIGIVVIIVVILIIFVIVSTFVIVTVIVVIKIVIVDTIWLRFVNSSMWKTKCLAFEPTLHG